MFYIKKHIDGDIEYIDASDIYKYFTFVDEKVENLFAFLYLIEQDLNYFNTNTSTAFGNPDLARIQGKIAGYCMAKGWDIEETTEHLIIKSGSRVKFKVERPKLPSGELENRREINRLLNNL